MRDTRRIRKFCSQLANVWETECPDWRFGQLVLNVLNMDTPFGVDPFYMEDEAMLEQIRSYFHKEFVNQFHPGEADSEN